MLGNKLLPLLSISAVLKAAHSQSPLSGKCKTENVAPITVDAALIPGRWNILYVSNTDNISELDHAYNVITRTGDSSYNLVGTKVLKNNKVFTRDYTMRIENKVMITELAYDGKVSLYKLYPLAKTSEDAILFYHCSDTGVFPLDVRFIAIPDGKALSDNSLQQLLNADQRHNFIGNLYKLPNDLICQSPSAVLH